MEKLLYALKLDTVTPLFQPGYELEQKRSILHTARKVLDRTDEAR